MVYFERLKRVSTPCSLCTANMGQCITSIFKKYWTNTIVCLIDFVHIFYVLCKKFYIIHKIYTVLHDSILIECTLKWSDNMDLYCNC